MKQVNALKGKVYFYGDGLHVTDGTRKQFLVDFATNFIAGPDRFYFTSGTQIWAHDPSAGVSPRGAIEGIIYNDLNGNGVNDRGESQYLAGFRVFLDLNNDGGFNSNEPWTRSDGVGKYRFPGLLPGEYTVRQTEVNGWLPTTLAAQTITVRRDRSTWVHFGNTLNRGAIEGFVYNDVNRNGVREPFEAEFLSGFRVFVDLNNDGRLNSNEPWTRSDRSGMYRFDELAPGNYTVRLTQVSGWGPTSPATRTITVRRSRTTPLHFGNTSHATASGEVFHDTNGNGLRDFGEVGLSGFRVFVDWNRNGRWDPDEPWTRSDESGQYLLEDAHGGFIVLGISTGQSWIITTSSSAYSIQPGSILSHTFGLKAV